MTAKSTIHLRVALERNAAKSSHRLWPDEVAWVDAQICVDGVMMFWLQSGKGWAPMLRQKGQPILEEVPWPSRMIGITWIARADGVGAGTGHGRSPRCRSHGSRPGPPRLGRGSRAPGVRIARSAKC